MSSPKIHHLSDYKQPDFTIISTQLLFKLGKQTTLVTAEFQVRRLQENAKILWLDGEDLQLQTVALDGQVLSPAQLQLHADKLGIPCDQDQALIKIEVAISPASNTHLSGLYVSGNNLCTQCEAQGFRRIMYSLDRPDVMSTYDVAVIYDVNAFPSVVAAGHCQTRQALSHGYAYVRYVDLTPKPTYLFAMIAGYFHTLEDRMETQTQKQVQLFIHLPLQYPTSQADFAMDALKKAMRWDERVFQCAYDLDVYHIAGFADFNFGAMENKGLNIFNTSMLLAAPSITTDQGYLHVLAVVGHEYFHNWTGNRVGCANWFQLSLKEGLTTYREMRFACDMYGPTARLGYIQSLVESQFREDRGPTAHAVIPDSYEKIDNFYTATIYTKGSEVLRMLEDIIGQTAIDTGVRQYLDRYDGQSVTIHEFLDSMQAQSDYDLTHFIRWYKQIGTPRVRVESQYDAQSACLTLQITQQASRADRQADFQPLIIPIRARLWSESGEIIHPDAHAAIRDQSDDSWVVVVDQAHTTICLTGVHEQPIVSSFLGLSAPVYHADNASAAEQAKLMAFETDPYVKMHSARACWLQLLSMDQPVIQGAFLDALQHVMDHWREQIELLPLVFALPSLQVCQEGDQAFAFDHLLHRHDQLLRDMACRWEPLWLEIFHYTGYQLQGAYRWSRSDVAMRRLQGLALARLLDANLQAHQSLALALYEKADNLTTQTAVLKAVLPHAGALGDDLLSRFQAIAEDHDLLINQHLYYTTFQKQDSLDAIAACLEGDMCDLRQPNRVSAWFSGWRDGNYALLHAKDGSGYAFLQDVIARVDRINPFTASRLIGALLNWQYFDVPRQTLMRQSLQALLDAGCSDTLREKIRAAV